MFFTTGRHGDPIAYVKGVVAVPSRREWKTPPEIGEEWEVEVCGTSRDGRVIMLRPVRRVATRAERLNGEQARIAAKDAWAEREQCAQRLLAIPREQWADEIARFNRALLERARAAAYQRVGENACQAYLKANPLVGNDPLRWEDEEHGIGKADSSAWAQDGWETMVLVTVESIHFKVPLHPQLRQWAEKVLEGSS